MVGPKKEDASEQANEPSGVEGLAVGLAHAINNPLAAVLANLNIAAEALDDGADPTEPLLEARSAAEQIRTIVKHLQVIWAPPNSASEDTGREFSPTEPITSSRAHRRPRVLVVDDEKAIRSALARGLRDCDVIAHDSARDALARIAAAERFDVIICDLMMPDMSGIELYEEALRVAPDQAPRMVFLTAGAVTARAREFVARVPNTVLAKPFDLQTLRDLVRERTAIHSRTEYVVMVVDDDPSVRALVVRRLEAAGFRCAPHASGDSAIRDVIADPGRVDAIVLDVMMPGLDGFEVMRQLKANPTTASIPIILLTAHALGEADIARGVEAGAAFYLTKPVAGPVLVANVRAACQRLGAERRLRTRLQYAEAHATTDALTGIMNRRAFDERLAEATANASRYQEPLALAMVDLDHFKQTNDKYGHAGGDVVLAAFGKALRRAVRLGDMAFRYGGEEFALLLRKCDVAGAVRVVQRIQTDLRGRPVPLGDAEETIRFSAGIAAADTSNGFRSQDLVARADAALYKAKHGGRDRIEIDEPAAEAKSSSSH